MQFHATPYDISASGFYFETFEEFEQKVATHRNDYGQPVEEYEIQFIEGDAEEAAMFQAFEPNQATIETFLEFMDEADDETKLMVFHILNNNGYRVGQIDLERPDLSFDGCIVWQGSSDFMYQEKAFKELAEEQIEAGYFGDIPEALAPYIDEEAYARDLAHSHTYGEFGSTAYIVTDC